MSEIPDKIEMIKFICSACGKRSVTIVLKDRMKCECCGYKYCRVKGEWEPDWKAIRKKK